VLIAAGEREEHARFIKDYIAAQNIRGMAHSKIESLGTSTPN